MSTNPSLHRPLSRPRDCQLPRARKSWTKSPQNEPTRTPRCCDSSRLSTLGPLAMRRGSMILIIGRGSFATSSPSKGNFQSRFVTPMRVVMITTIIITVAAATTTGIFAEGQHRATLALDHVIAGRPSEVDLPTAVAGGVGGFKLVYGAPGAAADKSPAARTAKQARGSLRTRDTVDDVLYCSSFACPRNLIPLPDSDAVECNDGVCALDQCCVAACSSFACPGAFIPTPNAEEVKCTEMVCTVDQCCLSLCSMYPCTGGDTPRDNADSIKCDINGCSQELCCKPRPLASTARPPTSAESSPAPHFHATKPPVPSRATVFTTAPTAPFVTLEPPVLPTTLPPTKAPVAVAVITPAPTVAISTLDPISSPTSQPWTIVPVEATISPSIAATKAPVAATAPPSPAPTAAPTAAPTTAPTAAPTAAPTEAPTAAPTAAPTLQTSAPSGLDSGIPTETAGSLFNNEFDIDGTNAGIALSILSVLAVGAVIASSLTSASSSPPSTRAPSATLGVLLVVQLQFVATLSLVQSSGFQDSSVGIFADTLKWVNLWPPASFATTFTGSEADPSRRLQREEEDDRGACHVKENEVALELLGNIFLVTAVLVVIFLLHIAVVSGYEAYLLAKRQAQEEIAAAHRRHEPIRHIFVRRWGGRQFLPDIDAKADGRISHALSAPRSGSLKIALPQESTENCRAEEAGDDGDDEEGGKTITRAGSRSSPIEEIRDSSSSIWLHFPHVELLFLLYAFEGAVGRQVSAIRDGACPAVVSLALVYLMAFPVLTLALVWRAFAVRVRPDALIVFKPDSNDDNADHGAGRKSSFLSRVWDGVRDDHSLFAWADQGQWATAGAKDGGAQREADRFRIGFEPIFVDFTKIGSWYILYELLQVAAVVCVGVVVDDTTTQFFVLCGLSSMSFALVLWFKPFANRVINAIQAATVGMDAVCMALSGVSSLRWEGTASEDRADTAVMMMMILVFCVLLMPIYIDTALGLSGAICAATRRKRTKREGMRDAQEEEILREERAFAKRFINKNWARIWWTNLGSNVFACARDTTAGVREPKPGPGNHDRGQPPPGAFL